MRSQIKHESVIAWLESDPKKIKKLIKDESIVLLYAKYSLWAMKQFKAEEIVDSKTFYKDMVLEITYPVDEMYWLERTVNQNIHSKYD